MIYLVNCLICLLKHTRSLSLALSTCYDIIILPLKSVLHFYFVVYFGGTFAVCFVYYVVFLFCFFCCFANSRVVRKKRQENAHKHTDDGGDDNNDVHET